MCATQRAGSTAASSTRGASLAAIEPIDQVLIAFDHPLQRVVRHHALRGRRGPSRRPAAGCASAPPARAESMSSSPAAARKPCSPSRTVSGIEPTRGATIGLPQAMASRIETGLASMCEVSTCTSISASSSGMSARVPRNSTLSLQSQLLGRAIPASARRGPSPMTRNLRLGNDLSHAGRHAQEQLMILLRPQGRHDAGHRRGGRDAKLRAQAHRWAARGWKRSTSTPLGMTFTLCAGSLRPRPGTGHAPRPRR